MSKPFSKRFAALFVVVMLLCSTAVALSLIHQADITEQISELQANLTAVKGRLRKQQVEYDEYLTSLPLVQAELEALQPEADAAYALEQALRQQRKDLRAENAALADEVSALQAQVDETGDANSQTAEAILQLEQLLADLSALHTLFQ